MSCFIGLDNPCIACLEHGRSGAYDKSQGLKVDGGWIHYYRAECRKDVGAPELKPRQPSKKAKASSSQLLVEHVEAGPAPKRQCTVARTVPPILVKIYEIKDARMCPVDSDSIVTEEDEPEVFMYRRNPAPVHVPAEQNLEYKVYGVFKTCRDDGGKQDTYWMSLAAMLEKLHIEADPPQLMEYVMLKIHDYEKKYLRVQQAHYSRACQAMGLAGPDAE
jgi:hypothetical protein